MPRNTVQCALVLDTVKRLQNHATADEIYEQVSARYPAIGRSTVYRNLQKLCETGQIRRRVIPGKADCYDHIVSNHYHVRCENCGRVFDVDMDFIPDLADGIRDRHGFVFTGHDITFSGICPDCASKEAHTGATHP